MNIRKSFVLSGSLLLLSGVFMPTAQALDDVRFQLGVTFWRFAEEIFGNRASDVALGTNLAQTATLRVLGDSGVAVGNTATIEYRLTNGGRFGSNLTASSLVFNDADSGGADVIIDLMAGGQAGDSSATFLVEVGSDGAEGIEAADTLRLTIPGIQGLPRGLSEDVLVQVYIEPMRASESGGNFRTLSPLEQDVEGSVILGDNITFIRDAIRLRARVAASPATIDVNMRGQFATNAVSIMRAGTTGLSGAEIGSVFYEAATIAANEGGVGGSFALATGARFRVSVAGNLHENAFFFIDLDGNKTVDVDDGELIPAGGLSISAADAAANLLNTALPATLMDQGRPVYFVTDGETDLVADDFTVTLALDFAAATYLDESRSVTTNIAFSGLTQDGFAYAIPNCTQTDRARIRVTNEDSVSLTLFVEGFDQAGTDMGFVEVDARDVRPGGGDSASLMPDETLVLFSRHVEQVFGFNDGQYDKDTRCTAAETWSGRAQLSFYASGNITVTPLIRGTDGQLRDLGGFTGLAVGMEGKIIGR